MVGIVREEEMATIQEQLITFGNEGFPLAILAADKIDTLTAELTKAQDTIKMKYGTEDCEGCKDRDVINEALQDELTKAQEEIERLNAKFKQLNKDLSHELRDPSGTIWEEADRLQKSLTTMTAERDALKEERRTYVSQVTHAFAVGKAEEYLAELAVLRPVYEAVEAYWNGEGACIQVETCDYTIQAAQAFYKNKE